MNVMKYCTSMLYLHYNLKAMKGKCEYSSWPLFNHKYLKIYDKNKKITF